LYSSFGATSTYPPAPAGVILPLRAAAPSALPPPLIQNSLPAADLGAPTPHGDCPGHPWSIPVRSTAARLLQGRRWFVSHLAPRASCRSRDGIAWKWKNTDCHQGSSSLCENCSPSAPGKGRVHLAATVRCRLCRLESAAYFPSPGTATCSTGQICQAIPVLSQSKSKCSAHLEHGPFLSFQDTI
jgi:hypothetical protein